MRCEFEAISQHAAMPNRRAINPPSAHRLVLQPTPSDRPHGILNEFIEEQQSANAVDKFCSGMRELSLSTQQTSASVAFLESHVS
jgi:hypothetical protein